MTAELLDQTITEVAALTRSGAVSSVELVSGSLHRIDRAEPDVNAFVVLQRDNALRTAHDLDTIAPSDRGLLHGMPMAVKDIFNIAGLPTRRGSRAFDGAVPEPADADCVRRLRHAGAVIVGKTHTHELACGVFTPPTRNPWDLQRSAGGSSGGSAAAVAARLVFAATGSDTGGSIRIPAALCGIVGFKPTYGRVSRHGCATLAWSLDHVGPLTRSVADAWLLLQVLAGPDPRDPATVTQPILGPPSQRHGRGARLGVPSGIFVEGLTEGVSQAWGQAVSRLSDAGMELVDITIPGVEGALAAEFSIVLAEAAAYYERLLRSRPNEVGEDVRLLLEAGLRLPALTYLRAQRTRELLQSGFREAFVAHRLDAILAPTVPSTAQLHDQTYVNGRDGETVADAFVRTTGPFNLSGMPCFSLPAGLASDGLPVAVQVAGRPYGEADLHGVASYIESVLGPSIQPRAAQSEPAGFGEGAVPMEGQ
jgi:aspartyl-tRNA(Asn)/glutamyl-tRNA(Gln) amidotransferase subunit A